MSQEKRRIEQGLQCPECHGVRIEWHKIQHNPTQYACLECGCQWRPRQPLDESGQSAGFEVGS